MINYVQLDNLPGTSNFLLNVLWDKNQKMTLNELMESVNTEFSKHWDKKEIRQFLNLLIRQDYVEVHRKGLKVYYAALGSDYQL